MSTAIVLPQLGSWAQNHIRAIVQATNEADFDGAFDAFVAKDAEITFNGKKISRDEYKTRLQTEAFRETGAQVVFNGTVQVPGTDASGVQSSFIGEAGLFYTAIIGEALLVLGAPQQRQVTSSINIFVQDDSSLKPPTLPGGIHGFFDPRRAFKVNQVFLDVTPSVEPNTTSTSS
ncbi:hypothetical protein K435DRAFT_778771 [Dendrothele bispora CBS 962.96]|uniref:SnoaL-like domain-containing protein n=1 Tax=Dendrothele bispora (strain CBS 962.96) TaxID=1314807 RepID=A0A4S8M1M9_DENBC|nr:hypothetical protein K435DRAFT_778771 [Dendrothele bispora CBS 962.96]